MITQKPLTSIRNPFGPRADRLAIAYAIDGGVGTSNLTNLGLNYPVETPAISSEAWKGRVLDDADALAEPWESDAEGSYLSLSSGATSYYVRVFENDTGDTEVLLRGTLMFRFAFRSTTGAVQPILNTGVIPISPNFLVIQRSAAGDLEVTINRVDSTDRTIVSWSVTDLQIYTLIVTWGESGFDAWLDGVAGTVTEMPGGLEQGDPGFDDSRPLFDAYWTILNAKELWIGKNVAANYGDINLYAFCMWDYQLQQVEREELIVDAYLPFRPRAQDYTGSDENDILATDVNPMPCRPRLNPDNNTDEITFSIVTSRGKADGITVSMRILYSTNSTLSTYEVSPIGTQSDPRRQLSVVIDGLEEGTKYYWLGQYSVDGSEWFYFPGGKGRFYTQNRLSPNFSFISYTDDHICDTVAVDPSDYDIPYLGYGGDIIRYTMETANARKSFVAWRGMYDIYLNQDPHFLVNIGDYYYPDTPAQYDGDTNKDDTPYHSARFYRNWCNLLFKSGVMYIAQGNHEAEAGYKQRQDISGVRMQMRTTVTRKAFFPGPTYETYPPGGENETPTNPRVVNWIPDAGNNWVPALDTLSSSSGDQSQPGKSTITYDQNYRNNYILGFDMEDPYLAPLYDLYGQNRSPLENYYAWTCGDALFVVLDVHRYTEPGDPLNTGGSWVRSGPTSLLGDVQKQWLLGVLSSSTQKWKFVFAHNLVGGESISPNGAHTTTQYYARGSGANIKRTTTLEGTYNPYDGYTENPEEIELHEMFKKFKVTAFIHGHDHRFCHVINEDVNYITAGAFSTNYNWDSDRMRESYGYTEEGDSPTGNRLLNGIVAGSNNHSYMLYQITEDDATCYNRVCAIMSNTVSDTFTAPWLGRAAWAGPVYTPDSAGQITLSERPFDVYTVANVSDTIFDDTKQCNLYTGGAVVQSINLWPEDGIYDDWEEFHADNVITLNASGLALNDESVRVMHVPVTFYETRLLNATPESDDSVVQHNISPDSVVYIYNINVEGSQEVAEYYRSRHNLPVDNLLGLDMSIPTASSCETPISKSEFESTILEPLRQSIAGLSDSEIGISGEFQCAVIVLGYGTPLAYVENDGEVIAIASRLHRLNHSYERMMANHTYDRRGAWKFYDASDSSQLCLTAILDGPSVDAVKKLIDRSIAVSQQLFVSGKINVDPYGKKITDEQLQYQADILDFVNNESPNLGLTVETTVDESEVTLEPTVAYLKNDSFYWGWYNPTYSKDLFLNQNEKRVFLYNADDNGACQIHFVETDGTPFSLNGSDPWCNLAINVEPGYAATAGSVGSLDEYGAYGEGETGEDAYLRPRPFFEALHRGASLAEAFLFSSPYVNWKIVLIGDPLMTLRFASDLPADQDVNNTLIDNYEAIRRVKEAIETGLGWGERQLRIIQDVLNTNVDSQYNLAEELYLLYGLTEWRNKKDATTLHEIYNTPILGWLGYILKTTGLILDAWLSRENEKITERLQTALSSLPARVDIDADFVYPEGEWEYIFVYTHPRLTFENIHFEVQVFSDSDFTSIVIDAASQSDVTGWKYEQETDSFVQLASTGFPSNFSGRRVKFVSPDDAYLERTEIYYVRWRAVDSDGTPITNYEIDSNPLLVYR